MATALTRQGELNIVGDWPNPYGDDAAKAKDIEKHTWIPDTSDMLHVIRGGFRGNIPEPPIVKSTIELVTEVVAAGRQRSVRRLNLWTHGSPSSVMLKGKILLGESVNRLAPAFSDSDTGVYRELSVAAVDALLTRTPWNFSYQGRAFELRDLKASFTRGALVYVYACNAGGTIWRGVDRTLLKKLGELFGTCVVGFADLIGYWVTGQASPRERWKYSVCVGGCINPSDRVTDFHRLTTQARTVKKLTDEPAGCGARAR